MFALSLNPVYAGTAQTMKPQETTLAGPQARAIAVGYAEFEKTGFLIEGYEVIVAAHAEAFEIIFLPAAPEGRSVRGGQTPAGKEIHYWISRQDFSLKRTTFAR